MKVVSPNYTQTPNDLVDHWLPHLGEIELKVLLVIIRKTFGWRRIRDRISISQLEKFTGSCAKNVLNALNSLIKKGVITKEVIGPIGRQETYYELVIEEESNNSYPWRETRGTPGATPAPPGKLPVTKETEKETIQKKQLQAAAFSEQEKEKQQTKPDAKTAPPKPRIYECLLNIDIPEADKIEISARHSELVVKKAVAWATHPQTKINKTLVAAIKWACLHNPEIPKDGSAVIEQNRAYAKKYDGVKKLSFTISALNEYVEIDHGSPYTPPVTIKYTVNAFKEQFENALRKANIGIMRTA